MVSIWFPILGFIFGSAFGSLSKALADRSLTKRSFLGRSYCEACKKKLAWYDLLPILSYFFLRGRCRYCYKKIVLEYVFFEIILGLITAYLFYQYSFYLENALTNYFQLILFIYFLSFKVFIIVVLAIVFLTDFKKTLIPDRITYPSIIIAFGLLLAATIYRIWLLYFNLSSSSFGKYFLPPHSTYFQNNAMMILQEFFLSIIMAVALGLFFLLLIIITRGRGMGGGDLKLGIFLGLAFGFPKSLIVLMLSFLLGSIVGIVLLLVGKKKFGQTIPFGPFLSLAGLITLFWGEEILNWYLKLRF